MDKQITITTGNNIRIFDNEQFGQIRAIELDGEPWFVGKDVAEALGYKNPRDALAKHVDPEDKMESQNATPPITDNLGRTQYPVWINESGLYSLVLSSKLAIAKQFKRWITSEVIPSIRKTGGYIAGQENMPEDELLAKAVLVAQNVIKQREERIKALETKVEADAPKVLFAEQLKSSDKCLTVKQLSVLLHQNGYKTGEKRLFEEMRNDGFLCVRGGYKNEPAQHYLDMKLFEVRTKTFQYGDGSGSVGVNRQTLITQKGAKYLLDFYLRKHGLLKEKPTNILPQGQGTPVLQLVQ